MGVLEVRVIEAKNLENMDWGSESDPVSLLHNVLIYKVRNCQSW